MAGRKRGVTISQVAEAAGVARSSVSRAFSRPEILLPSTVERIKAAAKSLGYVPNYTARALSTGRHGNIALIVPDVANPFFPPLIRAAQTEADSSDFCVFLGNSDEDPAQEDRLMERFSGQVEGIILVSPRLPEEKIRAHAANLPLVLINRDVANIPRILIDSSSGITEAVQHLYDLGHKNIVYVCGPAKSWSNNQRRAAVRKAAQKLKLTFGVVSAAVPSYEAGRNVVEKIVSMQATAAIAFDDLTAQGLLGGLTERGINVPFDFSVVGCDDVLGDVTFPPLTSVSNRTTEAGKVALTLLLEMLQSDAIHDVRYVLETHLVLRNTTSALKPPQIEE